MAEEPYVHQEYPKHLYNPNGQLAVVHSAEERKALGDGWYESPAEYGVETAPAMPVVSSGGYQALGYAAPASAPVPGASTRALVEPVPQEALAEVEHLEEEAAQRRRRPSGS